MHEHSDIQLLRDYAGRGDEAAFRELVARHADLVYASALRQVNCPDLARDVSQSVFVDLARKAPSLTASFEENASLLGWLYRSTRFAALTLRRTERRRQDRERQAMDELDSVPETAPDWDQVRPVLDEAMSDLSDADREAILLRFFKNRDFRAVGSDLGISDDAAQKRVMRALDRLRVSLTRRGVTTTALMLCTALSAHAVPSAPPGFAASLAASALAHATLQTASTVALTKAIAMTTLQKTLITTALAVAVGAGLYQAHQAAQLRAELRALNQSQAPVAGQLHQLAADATNANSQIAALQEENQRLRKGNEDLPRLRGELARLRNDAHTVESRGTNDATGTAVKSWIDRVNLLKQRLQRSPEARTPELQLVTEQDWLNAAKGDLQTETDYRKALSALRAAGENKFIDQLQPALKKFMDANGNGRPPADLTGLQSFFDAPVDNAILQRYHVVPATDVPHLGMGGDWIITQVSTADPEYDQRWGIGPNGYGNTGSFNPSPLDTLEPAIRAYMAANNDLQPTDPAQLAPYVTNPAQQSVWQQLTAQYNALPPTENNRLEKAVKQFQTTSATVK